MKVDMARMLPPIVSKLCFMFDAWIVGSAAKEGVIEPRGYDIIISFSNWPKAATLIPASAKPNTFGGWKFFDEGEKVDVWVGDLADFLSIGKADAIWHPRSGKRYSCVNTK
jgi:hypothetical protein